MSDADELEDVRGDDWATFGHPALAELRDRTLEATEPCAVPLRSAHVATGDVVEAEVDRLPPEACAARAALLLRSGSQQARPPSELRDRETWAVRIRTLTFAPAPARVPGGQDSQDNRTKREFLAEWVRGVNSHGGFGKWTADVSFSPDDLDDILRKHCRHRE